MNYNLPRNLASLLLLEGTMQDTLRTKDKKGDTLAVAPRIRHQFQNVYVDTNPKDRVTRSIDRLSGIDFPTKPTIIRKN